MISEWTLQTHFGWINITFQNNFCAGRDFQVHCFAFYQGNASFSDKPSQKKFINSIGQGCRGSVTRCRVRTNSNCDLHHFILFPIFMKEVGSVFMNMPVHPCCFRIIDLHTVKPDIFDLAIKTSVNDYG